MSDMSSLAPSLPTSTALIIDPEFVRILTPLNDVDALALQACSAEDPANWNDVAMLWPRYRFHPENAEFADGLPFRQARLEDVIDALASAEAWFALDLVQRRVLTGGRFPLLRLRHEQVDEDGEVTHITILPPWWEMRQRVAPAEVAGRRTMPAKVPAPRRDILWGPAMTEFFAQRMLSAIAAGEEWIGTGWEGEPRGAYDATMRVHRDWLMTPRADLNGQIPRNSLHGGMSWIDSLAGGQTFRVYQNEEPVPVSAELSTYETAAMGRHEVILYFEACRYTIGAGWQWLLQDPGRIEHPRAAQLLAQMMNDYLANWLTNPFEDGPTPQEIIRCERSRIPLVAEAGSHVVDCDCPICEMMASEMFGPSIACYDGHALDVDGEFAFSIHATREEWEAEQREWAEMDARIEESQKNRNAENEDVDMDFVSVWRDGAVSEEAIPGDKFGHLRMAFLVAELVDSLKTYGAEQIDVDELNTAFREYRTALPNDVASSAEAFQQSLEQLSAKGHRNLVSRTADLQSRIDEQLRSLAGNDHDSDVPY